jgi:propanol-preferring alcohol dehydrogenase
LGRTGRESVANLTRADGDEFFETISRFPVRTQVQTYALDDANRALADLRGGRLQGAAVLKVGHDASEPQNLPPG